MSPFEFLQKSSGLPLAAAGSLAPSLVTAFFFILLALDHKLPEARNYTYLALVSPVAPSTGLGKCRQQ